MAYSVARGLLAAAADHPATIVVLQVKAVFWYQFPGEARLMGQISLGFVLVIA
jgi:hypothetical protein